MSDSSGFRPAVVPLLVAALVALPARANLAPIGLSEVGARWLPNVPVGTNAVEAEDGLGAALAAGDFNGDGADDLAIGIPDDNGNSNDCTNCGAVVVRFGAPGGRLPAAVSLLLNQEAPGNGDPAGIGERFGWALAAGDFDGDGRDDLAVGIPSNSTGVSGSGAVAIYYGRASGGLPATGDALLRQGADGLPGTAANAENFGWALAAGDFDGDGDDDLVIGAPTDGESGVSASGSVTVVAGSAEGLVPAGSLLLHSGREASLDEAELVELYGWRVAAGDLDGNGFDDLAIGVPGEDDNLGAIEVVFAAETGLVENDNLYLRPGDVGAVATDAPRFGAALAIGDFDGDGRHDLAIGSPNDSLGSVATTEQAGSATVLYGTASGLDLVGVDHWSQGTVFANAAYDQPFDNFGAALAAGDFDGDGYDDLVAAHPNESSVAYREGATTVMMGGSSGLVARYRYLSGASLGLPSGGNQHAGRALVTGDFDGTGFADLVVGVPYHDSPANNAGAAFVVYGALFADGFELGTSQRWTATQN